jgi:hypothetical protein
VILGQIAEDHSGIIWAENIRLALDDTGSGLLGARFVV